MKLALKLFLFFIISFSAPLLISEADMSYLVEEIVFSASSIMVGLTIALIGIYIGNINSIYLSLMNVFNNDDDYGVNEKIKTVDRLNSIKKELRENIQFIILSFVAIIILLLFKKADIPYVTWFIEIEFLSKVYMINSIILFLNALMVLAIYDTVMGAFKMSDAIEITYKE